MSLRDKLTAEEWDQQEKKIEAIEAAEKASEDYFELHSRTKSFQEKYNNAAAKLAESYIKAINEPEQPKEATKEMFIQKVGRVSRLPEKKEFILKRKLKLLVALVESGEVTEIYFYEKVKFWVEK